MDEGERAEDMFGELGVAAVERRLENFVLGGEFEEDERSDDEKEAEQ